MRWAAELQVRGERLEAKGEDKKMSWMMSNSFFFAKHLRISEKKYTHCSEKADKTTDFSRKKRAKCHSTSRKKRAK